MNTSVITLIIIVWTAGGIWYANYRQNLTTPPLNLFIVFWFPFFVVYDYIFLPKFQPEEIDRLIQIYKQAVESKQVPPKLYYGLCVVYSGFPNKMVTWFRRKEFIYAYMFPTWFKTYSIEKSITPRLTYLRDNYKFMTGKELPSHLK